MNDGQAFLTIIEKLSVDEPALATSEELVKQTESATPATEELDTPPTPSDPVELALFLTKKHFGIDPPIPARELSSGNVSSILSFLSLLHNVAIMRLVCFSALLCRKLLYFLYLFCRRKHNLRKTM
jgi:hypothetical protein